MTDTENQLRAILYVDGEKRDEAVVSADSELGTRVESPPFVFPGNAESDVTVEFEAP